APFGLPAPRYLRHGLCEPDAVGAAGADDLLVLLPRAVYRAMDHRLSVADPRRCFRILIDHLRAVRSRLLLRDHARRHPVDLARTDGRSAGAGDELLADDVLRHPAAGVS